MIELLDEKTINQIAAGEVIENPSNVVKELIENSIDAKAKHIVVEKKFGATSYLKIVDDGIGFIKDDIKIAFKKHATSKLKKIDDLQNIFSYGFRGEALSSISEISKVTMITKNAQDDVGHKIVVEFGSIGEVEDFSSNIGTTFIIEDIFSNVPVRKKFLKSELKESAYIEDTIIKFALSNENISFKYIVDGKIVFFSSGDGNLKNIIYNLYGKNIYENLIYVNDNIKDVALIGYISKPIIARHNRNDEIYFVNDRYVKNNIIKMAIEDAYSNYLMQHKFPFVVLKINIESDVVDVNVHPKKLEVRFANDDIIYYAIYNSIVNALKNSNLVHNETFDKNINDIKINATSEFEKYLNIKIDKADNSNYENSNDENLEKSNSSICENKIETIDNIDEVSNNDNLIKAEDLPTLSDCIKEKLKNVEKNTYEYNTYINLYNAISKFDDNESTNVSNDVNKNDFGYNYQIKNYKEHSFIEKDFVNDYKYIGQIFKTYILLEFDDKLYIVDQHAAHEKINYEKLMSLYRNNAIISQPIYPSIILTLTPIQIASVKENIVEFSKMGFDINFLENNEIKIDAVPYNIPEIGNENLIYDMISNFSDNKNKMEYNSIAEKIASMSCKRAIKANRLLSEMEVKNLISELMKLENPYNCPHGRPTIISLSKNEFEKKFGRIVE